jgi:hypothetical protein
MVPTLSKLEEAAALVTYLYANLHPYPCVIAKCSKQRFYEAAQPLIENRSGGVELQELRTGGQGLGKICMYVCSLYKIA